MSLSALPSLKLTGLPFNDSPMYEMLDAAILRRLTASAPAFHAKMSASQESERALPVSVQNSFTSLRESCRNFDPLGLCSKMFPDFSVATQEETLRKSSAFSWSSAGMGFLGACSTLSISESPNSAVACSLSEVLESHVPQRFFLSPKAAAGILRRAEKRGRALPQRLREALDALARGAPMMEPISSREQSHNPATSITMKTPIQSSSNKTRNARRQNSQVSDHMELPIMESLIRSENPTAITDEARHAEMDATISSQELCESADANKAREVPVTTRQSSFRMFEAEREIESTTDKELEFEKVARHTLSDRQNNTPLRSPKISAEKSERAKSRRNSARVAESREAAIPQSPTMKFAEHSTQDISKADGHQMQKKQPKEHLSVRRLTPTECETLQGFPKGWTLPATGRWATRSQSKSHNGSPRD